MSDLHSYCKQLRGCTPNNCDASAKP